MPLSLVVRMCTVALLAGAAAAPHAGELARESRPAGSFDQVVLRAPGELRIVQGPRETIAIEAERSVLPKLTAQVRSGVLYLDTTEGAFSTRQPIRFFVTVQRLARVAADGGEVAIGPVSAPTLTVQISGSADARLAKVDTEALTVEMDGAGDVSIDAGAVGTQRIVMTGAGDYAAPGLESRRAEVTIDGAGSAVLNVRERLTARVSGSGTVRYAGHPTVVRRITGAGSVAAAD